MNNTRLNPWIVVGIPCSLVFIYLLWVTFGPWGDLGANREIVAQDALLWAPAAAPHLAYAFFAFGVHEEGAKSASGALCGLGWLLSFALIVWVNIMAVSPLDSALAHYGADRASLGLAGKEDWLHRSDSTISAGALQLDAQDPVTLLDTGGGGVLWRGRAIAIVGDSWVLRSASGDVARFPRSWPVMPDCGEVDELGLVLVYMLGVCLVVGLTRLVAKSFWRGILNAPSRRDRSLLYLSHARKSYGRQVVSWVLAISLLVVAPLAGAYHAACFACRDAYMEVPPEWLVSSWCPLVLVCLGSCLVAWSDARDRRLPKLLRWREFEWTLRRATAMGAAMAGRAVGPGSSDSVARVLTPWETGVGESDLDALDVIMANEQPEAALLALGVLPAVDVGHAPIARRANRAVARQVARLVAMGLVQCDLSEVLSGEFLPRIEATSHGRRMSTFPRRMMSEDVPFVLQARLSLAEQAGAEGRRQEAMRLLLRDVLEPLCKWAIISVKGSLARSSSYRAFAKRMDADSVNAVVDRMGLGVMRVVMSQVGLVGPMAQLGRDHASLASPDAAAILDCLIEMRNQFSHDRVGSSAGGDEACGWVSTSDLLVANWLAGAACELVALRVRILAGRPGGDAQAALE